MASANQILAKSDSIKVSDPLIRKSSEDDDIQFGMARIRVDNKPLRVKMRAEIFRHLQRTENEWGTQYSIAIRLDDEDTELLQLLSDLLVANAKERSETVEVKEITDLLFIKVPVDSKHVRFKCEMNIPITPQKMKNDLNMDNEEITVECGISGWFRQDRQDRGEGKCGLKIKPEKLTFGPPPKKTTKRRKDLEEDDSSIAVHSPMNGKK